MKGWGHFLVLAASAVAVAAPPASAQERPHAEEQFAAMILVRDLCVNVAVEGVEMAAAARAIGARPIANPLPDGEMDLQRQGYSWRGADAVVAVAGPAPGSCTVVYLGPDALNVGEGMRAGVIGSRKDIDLELNTTCGTGNGYQVCPYDELLIIDDSGEQSERLGLTVRAMQSRHGPIAYTHFPGKA
ncbi:hypothetical protein [Brevundimonas sp.]|uniref:hypothetical protein n=1 Tax=Brevundimonas sp. TaxID=1871086 RepID=UPI0035674DE6